MMKENSLEPKESGKDWQPFWQFLDAIRKGDATIKKTLTRPPSKSILILLNYRKNEFGWLW